MDGFILKKLLTTITVLVLLAAAAAVVLVFSLGRVVKAGIERVGPAVTKVPLSVGGVEVSLLKGSFVLEEFAVGNPDGFQAEHAFRAGRIRVDAKLRSLYDETIVLPLVEVQRPAVTLEVNQEGSNLARLLRNTRLSESKSKKKLRVGTVRIVEPDVRIALPAGRELSISLPDVEANDLQAGGESLTPPQFAAKVLGLLYDRILTKAGDRLPGGRVEQLGDQLRQMLQSVRGGAEEGTGKLEEAAEEAKNSLGELLQ